MLRKLLKHEFRATARVMIPLYLITVLLAVLTRATALWAEMVTFDGMLGRNFLALLSGIIIFGFVLALIATFVVAVILAILRFRSNLMADEGYVMFTLPVSTHTLVWSKLIVSAVWFLGAVVVDVLSLLALVANVEMFWELGRVFQEIADQWNAYYVGNGVAFLVECLLLFLVFCVVACLEFYTPLAIGHSFAQHKMLLSVAFFFAIQVVTQIVSGMLLFAGVPMLDSMDGWLAQFSDPSHRHPRLYVGQYSDLRHLWRDPLLHHHSDASPASESGVRIRFPVCAPGHGPGAQTAFKGRRTSGCPRWGRNTRGSRSTFSGRRYRGPGYIPCPSAGRRPGHWSLPHKRKQRGGPTDRAKPLWPGRAPPGEGFGFPGFACARTIPGSGRPATPRPAWPDSCERPG